MIELERKAAFGDDRSEGPATVAIRAPSETIVASAVRRTLLVLSGEDPDGAERVGRRVNHPAELKRERKQRGADEPGKEGAIHGAFRVRHCRPRATAEDTSIISRFSSCPRASAS
jgi:hypothetical protein